MEIAEDTSESNVVKSLLRDCTGLFERGELERIKKLCRPYVFSSFCNYNYMEDKASKYLATLTDEEAYDEITFFDEESTSKGYVEDDYDGTIIHQSVPLIDVGLLSEMLEICARAWAGRSRFQCTIYR
jgi:hypothetical protein